jgi:hypothetical protein
VREVIILDSLHGLPITPVGSANRRLAVAAGLSLRRGAFGPDAQTEVCGYIIEAMQGQNIFMKALRRGIYEAGLLGASGRLRVKQACTNVARIDVKFESDLLMAPAAGKQVKDEFHGDASPFDNWLANQNLGIDCDSLLPVHVPASLQPSLHCGVV